MIVYAADRAMNILGVSTTENRRGLIIGNDSKIEDVETGVASFEATVYHTKENRADTMAKFEVGNYLLRKDGSDEGLYTIVEAESDPEASTINVYAEDAGLDLLNNVCAGYTESTAKDITQYVGDCIEDTGFEIGINTYGTGTMALDFDEQTAKARLDFIAASFGAEICYSFKIEGMTITHMYVNIYKKRGSDTGVQLVLGRDVGNIRVKKNIDKLATGLIVVGGTGDNSDIPINLEGYEYDDGDFYVSGRNLYSREALKRWARFLPHERKQAEGVSAHIMQVFRFDTVSQELLCQEAIKELAALREPAVNYEVDIMRLPDSIGIGDTLYVVDRDGELYLQGRVLKMETRCAEGKRIATLGDFLIKDDITSERIDNLTRQIKELQKDQEKTEDLVRDKRILKIVIEHCLATNRVIPLGGTFEDIRATAWSETLPDYVEGKFYWARIATYYVDGTIEYGPPYFDMSAQVTAEVNIAVQEAQDTADEAERIAREASQTAGASRKVFNATPVPPYGVNDLWFDGAHGVTYLCSTPKAEGESFAQADWTEYSKDVSSHFWTDSSGAHIAEVQGDVTTGASQTIASTGTVMMRNGKVISSWTGTGPSSAAINFYDCSNAQAQASDLIASYGRAGITHYINNIVCQALTASGLSFFSPDSNHWTEAIFGPSGVQLYALGVLAMALASGNMKFYDDDGVTELAEFGKTSAQIGKDGATHTTLNSGGMEIFGGDGTEQLAHLGYDYGYTESGGVAQKPYFTFGDRGTGSIGNFSFTEGQNNVASAAYSHAEGARNTVSSTGAYAHVEGGGLQGNTAAGYASHVEGSNNTSTANAAYSHVGGIGNRARYEAQTIIGKYAPYGDSDDLLVVGNGAMSHPSAAMRLKTDGHVEFAGAIGTGLRWKSRSEMCNLVKNLKKPSADMPEPVPYNFTATLADTGSSTIYWGTTAGAEAAYCFGTICRMDTTHWHMFFMCNGNLYKSVFTWDGTSDTDTATTGTFATKKLAEAS